VFAYTGNQQNQLDEAQQGRAFSKNAELPPSKHGVECVE